MSDDTKKEVTVNCANGSNLKSVLEALQVIFQEVALKTLKHHEGGITITQNSLGGITIKSDLVLTVNGDDNDRPTVTH